MTAPSAMCSVDSADVATPPSTDGSILGYWDDLFRAVTARLRLLADAASPEGAATSRLQGPSAGLQAGVLECADALDQLHATLLHEVERCRRIERDAAACRAALAQARAELAGSRADEQRAWHSALHDGLTLLPNASHFRARLDEALFQAAPDAAVAVLYLDLDGFKPINDAHGHDTGDALLRIVAARLSRAVRADDMVGRLGGDEFACLLSGTPGREQLSHLACKLLDTVSAPVAIGPLQISVRPSIGIAVAHADATSAEALLRSADAAMYCAKRRKCGYAFFDDRDDVVGPAWPAQPALRLLDGERAEQPRWAQ